MQNFKSLNSVVQVPNRKVSELNSSGNQLIQFEASIELIYAPILITSFPNRRKEWNLRICKSFTQRSGTKQKKSFRILNDSVWKIQAKISLYNFKFLWNIYAPSLITKLPKQKKRKGFKQSRSQTEEKFSYKMVQIFCCIQF